MTVDAAVLDWLLAGDPAIRWQVMRDLLDATPEAVAAERGRVAHEGWGAAILAAQDTDGCWGGGTFFPRGTGTFDTLHLLCLLGPDSADEAVRRAIAPVHDAARWDYDPSLRFWEGEVEPCINGRVVLLGARFGQDVTGVVRRLLGEQMDDGGWNCEQENGSVRGSFDTTINVLEGLLAFEQATPGRQDGSPVALDDVRAARVRGEDYLLERGLLRRRSDGEVGDRRWLQAGFPDSWNYDILRVLDHLRASGRAVEARMDEALRAVEAKTGADGRWPLEVARHDTLTVDLGEVVGSPSRWLTLRALRVLRWAGREPGGPRPA